MLSKNWITYPAYITQSVDGKYFVEFPDLPGCYTQGETIEDAFCNAQEALAIYYQQMDCKMPQPSNLESVLNLKKGRDSISYVQLISIDINSYIVKSLNSVKKTLTIPEWLNKIAEKYHINFSNTLKNALITQLQAMSNLSEYDRRMLSD